MRLPGNNNSNLRGAFWRPPNIHQNKSASNLERGISTVPIALSSCGELRRQLISAPAHTSAVSWPTELTQLCLYKISGQIWCRNLHLKSSDPLGKHIFPVGGCLTCLFTVNGSVRSQQETQTWLLFAQHAHHYVLFMSQG